jgi:hypothetical protein
VDSDAGEEAREEGDRDDDRDGDGPGDHSPWAGQVHGSAVRESTARRAQVPELLEAVLVGRKQVMRAERALTKRVGAARANGATWEDIGLAMGMSRQGAAKRFGSSAR